MATDVDMDADMDYEIDFDADVDELARLQAAAAEIRALPSAMDLVPTNGEKEGEDREEGEVNLDDAVGNKVYIHGTDQLSTKDIENLARDHFPSDLFKRIEWINDSAANAVYESDEAAREALNALSAEIVDDPLELRPAKQLATHPEVQLSVRQARVGDRKQVGAAKYSRYYLFNPDADPELRPRKRKFNDDPTQRLQRRAGHQSDNATHRRGSREEKPFDVSLYDDDTGSSAAGNKGFQSDGDLFPARKRAIPREKAGADLFAGKKHARLRDRSASPLRDGDGRFGFNDIQPYRKTARHRSPSPGPGRSNRDARQNLRLELFPEKRSAAVLIKGTEDAPAPDAKNIRPDEVADAIGKYALGDQSRHDAYERSGHRSESAQDNAQPRDLFSRISGGPGMKVQREQARLQDSTRQGGDVSDGFSIRGAGNSGFSILGASKDRPDNTSRRELFPKASPMDADGNVVRDLFDRPIKGRGAHKKVAGDLFLRRNPGTSL